MAKSGITSPASALGEITRFTELRQRLLFLVGALTLLFRGTIEKLVSGLFVFMGNDYNEDDVVEVDGEPARIVRVSMWKTVFFIYHVIAGTVVGGRTYVVANSKLKDLKLEKPLDNLTLATFLNAELGFFGVVV